MILRMLFIGGFLWGAVATAAYTLSKRAAQRRVKMRVEEFK